MLHFNVIARQVMTGSSEKIFWYLFNGFLHVDNFVVELFFPAKILEMSPGRWCPKWRVDAAVRALSWLYQILIPLRPVVGWLSVGWLVTIRVAGLLGGFPPKDKLKALRNGMIELNILNQLVRQSRLANRQYHGDEHDLLGSYFRSWNTKSWKKSHYYCARRAASILKKQLAGSVSLENSSVKMVEMRDS